MLISGKFYFFLEPFPMQSFEINKIRIRFNVKNTTLEIILLNTVDTSNFITKTIFRQIKNNVDVILF